MDYKLNWSMSWLKTESATSESIVTLNWTWYPESIWLWTELNLAWTGLDCPDMIKSLCDCRIPGKAFQLMQELPRLERWYVLRGVLRIRIQSNPYSSQFLFISLFYSCEHLQSAGVCCDFVTVYFHRSVTLWPQLFSKRLRYKSALISLSHV